MRGHIAKKGNRYWVVVSLGSDPATGKRRRAWHGSWGTRDEAESAYHGILASIEDATYVEPQHQTLEHFLVHEWLPGVATTIRPSTHSLYTTMVGAYVIPRLGQVQLQKLEPTQLNRLYGQLLKAGRRDGSALSAEMVAKVHRVLHRALRDAVKWNRIPRNPAELADPPRAPHRELEAWSASQLAAFLDEASKDRLAAL